MSTTHLGSHVDCHKCHLIYHCHKPVKQSRSKTPFREVIVQQQVCNDNYWNFEETVGHSRSCQRMGREQPATMTKSASDVASLVPIGKWMDFKTQKSNFN